MDGDMDNDRIYVLTQSTIALVIVILGGIGFMYLMIHNLGGGEALTGLIGAVISYYFVNTAVRQATSSAMQVNREANTQAQAAASTNGKGASSHG